MRDNWKQILKLMFGAGLMLMDTDRREKVARKVRSRVDDWGETARDRYEDARDRVENISDAIRGRRHYGAPIGGFLVGMGIGVGLGMLFAPASGEETRSNIVEQATSFKDRVAEKAQNIRDRASEQASQFREQVRDTVRGESTPGGPTPQPYSRPA